MRFVGIILACLLLMLSRANAAGTESYRVGITDYGVNIMAGWNGTTCDPTGVADSTACIQAGIDQCIFNGNNCRTTFCPDGIYKTSQPIFVDPPGNLRGADGSNGAAYSLGGTFSQGQTVNYLGVPYISLVNNNIGNTPSSSPSQWQAYNYNAATTYAVGAIVRFNGVPWISLQNSNTGNTPSTSSSFWALSNAAPTNFAFSLTFTGNPGIGNAQNVGGCEIRPQFANGCAFWIGTGQGMNLAHLSIRQTTNSGYRGKLPSSGVGVCGAGGGAGASRTLIEGVGVYNMYTCFQTGVNQDELNDSNTWLKTDCSNAYYCIYVSETQNDINHAIDTTCSATVAYYTPVGPGIIVDGGNPSSTGVSNSFSISSTGSLATASCSYNGNIKCYTFQTTLASPDQYVCTVYNSYAISTSHFGVIPLVPTTSCNGGTGVITFQISPTWGGMGFQQTNGATSSALQTDIQNATTIYAVERVTTYWGAGIKSTGQHIENVSCTTLAEVGQGFSGDKGIEIDKVRFNYDPGLTVYAPPNSPTAAQRAQYYCQQSFGFFISDSTSSGGISAHDSWFSQSSASEPVLIDWGSGDLNARLVMTNNGLSLFAPNMRTTSPASLAVGGALNLLYTGRYCAGCGAGDWDQSPFLPRTSTTSEDYYYRSIGPLASPFIGFYPAPWTQPRLTPTDITALTGALGTLGTYPIINGSTIYSVVGYDGSVSTGCTGGSGSSTNCLHAQSNQLGFSYGQNLTTSNVTGLSWGAQGGSFVVNLDSNSMGYMQAGLQIELNTSANEPYIVTGVYPGLGYITVQQASSNGVSNGIAGTNGTNYTGTTISQQPYAITLYP